MLNFISPLLETVERGFQGGIKRKSQKIWINYMIKKFERIKGRNGSFSIGLVDIRKEYKSIFQRKQSCAVAIRIESYNRRAGLIQC